MQADSLSLTFAALADPTRRAILARLLLGECSVTDLAAPFEMTLPGVSKHLRVLEHAGLIARRREAQRHHCRIEADRLKEVSEWTECYRHVWEHRMERLDDYLKQMQKPKATPAKEKKAHERNARRK